MNEQEKKRTYNKRILQIDHGTFTLLVFLINGSMGRECQNFTHICYKCYLKKETIHSRFQVIGFEQKFALGC